MRFGYAVAIAACLGGSPAMAELVIGGDHDSARHEDRADQQREAAHHDMDEARQKAAVGNFRGAAHEQAEAREHRSEAREHERRADRDRDHDGVRVEIGH